MILFLLNFLELSLDIYVIFPGFVQMARLKRTSWKLCFLKLLEKFEQNYIAFVLKPEINDFFQRKAFLKSSVSPSFFFRDVFYFFLEQFVFASFLKK